MNIELNYDITDLDGMYYKIRCNAVADVIWELGHGFMVRDISLNNVEIRHPESGIERYESCATIHGRFPEQEITRLKNIAKSSMIEKATYDFETLRQVQA